MRERGFILPALPIAAWGAIGAAVIILGLGLALKAQSARLDAAQAETEACKIRYAETLDLVRKQNKAVEALEIESQKRARNAAAALAKAREGQGSLKVEIERLQGAIGKGATCSGAVEQVRRGLKP